MEKVRRAVIDVGTNSVKLLVADVEEGQVEPVHETSEQTRLGEGFYPHHVLNPSSIQRTALAVEAFRVRACFLGATACRVIATSAARDAVNRADLTVAIRSGSGLEVEIISGEQEADWSFQGVTTDPSLRDRPLLITDVGGGSSEFILGSQGRVEFRRSFQIGTVRLLGEIAVSDPPGRGERVACEGRIRRFFQTTILPELGAVLKAALVPPSEWIGTGGTATLLARIHLATDSFDRTRLEQVRLRREDVIGIADQLWSLPLAERRRIVGLPPNRADVILMGTAIFSVLMHELGYAELRMSTRGLRFAAVRDGGLLNALK